MSLFDTLFGQFIDVIAWTDDSGDTLVRRFERHGHEIKYGAKLTVREGQAAAFVHEGRLADVFPPGLYRLRTNNLPILSTLQHWDHGFESPFKSEIYFVSTRRFSDLKWGTRNPVMLRDPEFGPIRPARVRRLRDADRRARRVPARSRRHRWRFRRGRDFRAAPQHHRRALLQRDRHRAYPSARSCRELRRSRSVFCAIGSSRRWRSTASRSPSS